MQYIFVYGTLMKNRRNNGLLVRQKYVGPGILENYAMYEVNSEFPGIVPLTGEKVQGEVYLINGQILNTLDRFESEGDLYIRKTEKICINKKIIEAFIYVWNGNIDNCKKVSVMPWKSVKGR